MDAKVMLDREFLEMRCRLMDLAASFDRLSRAGATPAAYPRLQLLHEGVRLLAEPQADRAARMQMLFSDAYDPHWRGAFGL